MSVLNLIYSYGLELERESIRLHSSGQQATVQWIPNAGISGKASLHDGVLSVFG